MNDPHEKSFKYITDFLKNLAPDANIQQLPEFTFRIDMCNELTDVRFDRSEMGDFEIAFEKHPNTNYFYTLENRIKYRIYVALGAKGLIPNIQISSELLREEGDWLKNLTANIAFNTGFCDVLIRGLALLSDSIEKNLSTGLKLPEIEAEKSIVDHLKKFYDENGHLNSQGVGMESLSYLKAAAVCVIMEKEKAREAVKIARLKKAIDVEIYSIVSNIRSDPFRDIKLPEAIHDYALQQGEAGNPKSLLNAPPNEAGNDSPMLSRKFGILRDETQLVPDFSSYENDAGGLGLLFFDIDNFKALNTKHTETVVDLEILNPFNKHLIEVTQSRGFAYSIGGDEFLILLRNVDPIETLTFANRLLDSVRKREFIVKGEAEILTISVGVACYPNDANTLIDLRKMANAAENKAKHDGKNRVVCSSSNARTLGIDSFLENEVIVKPRRDILQRMNDFDEAIRSSFPKIKKIHQTNKPNEITRFVNKFNSECQPEEFWYMTMEGGDNTYQPLTLLENNRWLFCNTTELDIEQLIVYRDSDCLYKSFFVLLIAPGQPFKIIDNNNQPVSRYIPSNFTEDAAVFWDGKYIDHTETTNGYYDNGEEIIPANPDLFCFRTRHLRNYAYIIVPRGTATSVMLDRTPTERFLVSIVNNSGITEVPLKEYLDTTKPHHSHEITMWN